MKCDKYIIPFVANAVFICNELYCFDQGNQLLIITNAMNIITILQTSNFNVFLHGYFLQCSQKLMVRCRFKELLLYIRRGLSWLTTKNSVNIT